MNFKSDLDASDLAAGSIDLNYYAEDQYNFHIVGEMNNYTQIYGIVPTNQNVSALSSEYQDFMGHFHDYLDALRSNIGISNEGFRGGSCGWAANYLNASDFKVEEFSIIEPVDEDQDGTVDHVLVYRTYDVTDIENPNAMVNKEGYVGNQIEIDGTTVIVEHPSVYSRVSFQLMNPRNIFRDPSEGDTYQRVVTAGMCGIKKHGTI